MSQAEYCTTATFTFIFQNSTSELTGKDAANPRQQNHLQQMLPGAAGTSSFELRFPQVNCFIFSRTFLLIAVDKERLQYSGMLYISGTRQKIKNFKQTQKEERQCFLFPFLPLRKQNKTRKDDLFRNWNVAGQCWVHNKVPHNKGGKKGKQCSLTRVA